MRRLSSGLFLLLIALFSKQSIAQKITVNENHSFNSKIELISDEPNQSQLKLSFNSFELIQIETPNGIQSKVIAAEASGLYKKGYPDIPKLTQSIIISEANGVDVVINDTKFVEYQNINLAPSKGVIYRNTNPADVAFEYAEVYQKDEFFPGNLVSANTPYILRDKRGVSVWMYPVQYNPVTKVLRIYTEIDFSVKKNKEKGANELLHVAKEKAAVFQDAYAEHFINYSKDRYDVVNEEGSLLIIAHDDFSTEMDDFIAWKKQRGMDVSLVNFSEVGTTDDDIIDYVNNIYETDGLTFLLLVGDAEQIPATVKKGNDSDAAYGHLSGGDSYAEVIVGRFSGETAADIATQVERTIHYERDLTSEDDWLSAAIGIASAEGGPSNGDDGESDIEHMNNVRQDLIDFGYTTVHQIYDPGASASDVASAVNAGSGIINYIGHGSDYSFVTTGFSNSDVNALTNTGKLPFIFSVACVNGNFVGNTCFAEAWLRATHNDEPAGAVAMYASTINQSWAPPMDGQDEMNDLLTHIVDGNTKVTFGGIAINGSMHMNDEYGTGGEEMTDTWTIFGDPTLIVRNTTPQAITPDYTAALPIGSPELQVSAAADGAVVCLIKDEVKVASGVISGGSVILDISEITVPGAAQLVMVGQQIETFIGEFIFIVPSGPYMISSGYAISNDDNSDGFADYNESFNVDITLKNVGIDVAQNVKVSLTSVDEYVETISLNSEVSMGNVGVDETVSSSNSFNVKLEGNVPNQYAIDFSLTIDADNYDETWNYKLNITANAPSIVLESVEYNDDFDGNIVDGTIAPGESGEVICMLANVGNSNISQLAASLVDVNNSGVIVLNTGSVSDVSIDGEGMAQVTFSISTDADIYPGSLFPFQVAVNAGDYIFENDFDLRIGVLPEVIIGDADEVVSCFGTFYDSGKDAAYENDETKITTIKPAMAGNKIEIVFDEFAVESGYDYLYIYDGETVSADQVEGSPFSGANVPGTIRSTDVSGALTFKFTSDGYVTEDGWKADFQCVSEFPTCVNIISPENSENLECNFTKLEWSATDDAVAYNVYVGESIGTKPSYIVTETSIKIFDLKENTEYKFKVVPENEIGNTAIDCEEQTFTTGGKAIIMHTGAVSVMDGFFFDDGAMDPYGMNITDTLTLVPEIEGKAVSVSFMELALEKGFDKLHVYNGISVDEAVLIGVYDDSDFKLIGDNGNFTASNAEGALTFMFVSDDKTSGSGWKATIELVELVSVLDNSIHTISVHPNPVNSLLTISAKGNCSVNILDVSGKILYQNEGQEIYEVNMADYNTGLYFVQLIDHSGVLYTQKVIKQ